MHPRPFFQPPAAEQQAYGTGLITYVTSQSMAADEAQVRIWSGGKTYPLDTISAGSAYLIDAAQFQGHWYYVAGSSADQRISLYKDPLSGLQDSSVGKAVPFIDLIVQGATKTSFSTNARFIGVEAGQSFGVYDLETQTRYQYTLQQPLAGVVHWMDGHRWLGASNGTVFVTDYDSTNPQLLVPVADASGGYFNPDYTQLYVLAPISGGSSVSLQDIDMRAGADLPKNLQQ